MKSLLKKKTYNTLIYEGYVSTVYVPSDMLIKILF